VSESNPAVFLSYASEDAPAAQRICETLRASGIEVWFDQSELRGGDVWDAAIRRQIKACALFVPIISANSHAREEGYFRLEWKLAVDRSHLMASEKAFLLPVVVDATHDADARVPDKFREVQWTRLPAGETPAAFVERILRLLSPQQHAAPTSAPTQARAAPVPSGVPASVHAANTAAGKIQSPSSRSRFALWLSLAVVVVAVGYFAIDKFVASKHLGEAARTSATAVQPLSPARSTIPEKSIAVLPFIDLSEKKDQEYFSDGLAEELIDLLAQVPDLRVSARTSSFYFKGKSEDVAVIAQKLRVAQVLEGSVRKAGNTIRVTAQLIRADNGYHLWSKTYDRDVKDIFKIQDEIASAVVDALKAQLLPAQQIVSRHRTDNTEAYTEYLLGNQFRVRDTVEDNQRALAAYQKAVALDPSYAAAYSGLADAEWRIADQLTGEAAGYQRAAAAADKAIALAPDSPEGYWARGRLRNNYFFDWYGAEADYQKALALDPNYVPAQVGYAGLLATLGRSPEALTMYRRALALDPLSVVGWRELATLLIDNGQFTEGRVAVHRITEIDPSGDRTQIGAYADLFDGRTQQALTGFQTSNAVYSLVGSAMADFTLGHAAESQRALDEVIRQRATSLAYQIAEVYAWRGENDKAFEWLERAYRQRDGGLTHLKTDRSLAKLRSDPRYQRLLRKLKLPQ
jgi:TolB-like protein